jgi:hypothetical protein
MCAARVVLLDSPDYGAMSDCHAKTLRRVPMNPFKEQPHEVLGLSTQSLNV